MIFSAISGPPSPHHLRPDRSKLGVGAIVSQLLVELVLKLEEICRISE